MTDSQGLLFGSAPDAVDDEIARSELRLLAANVEGLPATRVNELLAWLYDTQANVLVLSEVKTGGGARQAVSDLEASGFTVHCGQAGPDDDAYAALVATKGYPTKAIQLSFATARLVAVRLTTHLGELDVVGLYSLTNGLSEESSQRRRAFQEQVIAALTERVKAEPAVPAIVTGDLNILHLGHQPPSGLFRDHDYAFYRDLLGLGLTDAYRRMNPDSEEVTWYGPSGGQRLDHTLISTTIASHIHTSTFHHSIRTQRISDHAAVATVLR